MNGIDVRWRRVSASGELVGQRPGVAGDAGAGGVDLVQEQGQCPVDTGCVVGVEGDGDLFRGIGDGAGLVHQGAGDGPVLVGVLQVDVEVVGQPGVGVVSQQSQGHQQAAAVGALQGTAGGAGDDGCGAAGPDLGARGGPLSDLALCG